MPTSTNPFLSVIVVSRNRHHFLAELLRSLHQQTCQSFEVILVENASKAPTRDYVSNLVSTTFPLKTVFLDQEQTISYCRNYPFRHQLLDPRSTYVYFIDDDDAIFSATLQTLLTRIERTGAQVVVGNSFRAYCSGQVLRHPYRYVRYRHELNDLVRTSWKLYMGKLLFANQRWLFTRHFNRSGALPLHSLLFKRELLTRHLFTDQITHGEDSLLFYHLSAGINKVSTAPTVFVIYRRHADNTDAVHNYGTKVKADPLCFAFGAQHYTSAELYVVFFYEYLRAKRRLSGRLGRQSAADSSLVTTFQQRAETVPLGTKLKTLCLYPVLSLRYTIWTLIDRCRGLVGKPLRSLRT